MLQHIISASKLLKLLSHHNTDNEIILFDCRFALADTSAGQADYQAGHLPEAYYLHLNNDLASPPLEHGGRHPLPRSELFAATMRRCGVNKHSHIVIYDDQRFAFAARLWWLLRYFGHQNVQILDGGYSGWLAQGYAISTAPSPDRAGDFEAHPHPHWVVDHPSIEHALNSSTRLLIDSREAARYLGLEESIDPIAGHIPGAANYPWQEVTDKKGYVLCPAQQQQRWLTLPADKELVVYCGSGVTACVNLLSLQLAGISDAKLYPGSWSDWCSYLKPVE